MPRAGTTWLHELLAAHPDVTMPHARKELHYFDENFDRGPQWYDKWFAPSSASAVGEITPHYLYDPACISRIQDAGIDRLIVILREPVGRAISHYRFRCRVDDSSAGFDEFLTAHPEAVEWGRYATYLGPWLDAFGRDAICALRFEHAVNDVDATMRTISAFLGVEAGRFPAGAGLHPVNESGPMRHPRAFALAKRVARRTRRFDSTWMADLARRAGLDRGRSGSSHPIEVDATAAADLRAFYSSEIAALERLLDWDLNDWRNPVRPF